MKSKHFLIASIVIFLISLVLPVHLILDNFTDYYTNDNRTEYLGYVYLILGYITILELPIDFICWLGNFTLLFGWIFYKKKAGIVLSIFALLQMSLYGINHLFELDFMEIKEYGFPLFGYWFWLLSAILLVIATITHYKTQESKYEL